MALLINRDRRGVDQSVQRSSRRVCQTMHKKGNKVVVVV